MGCVGRCLADNAHNTELAQPTRRRASQIVKLNEAWSKPLLIYVMATLAYGGFYALNNFLTPQLYWVPGAHVIHIPSGIKLLMVLVFGYLGSLSVLTAVFVAGPFSYFYTGEFLLPLEIAMAAALAPWLTARFFVDRLWVNPDLSNLNLKLLLYMGLLFATLNASMIQSLLSLHQISGDFFSSFAVMFLGDITGVLIVLGLMRAFLLWRRRLIEP